MTTQTGSDWPPGFSRPAISALKHAGYQRLDQLTTVTERSVANLHGMGPKGVRILQAALTERGLAFAQA